MFPKHVECEALKGFEQDLWNLIKGVEFRPVRNAHQAKLSTFKKKVKECSDLLVNSDKTGNLYRVTKAEYNDLLINEVTKTYKKENIDKVTAIDKKAKDVANKLGIESRVMRTKQSQCFLTLKDHKADFNTNPQV